MPSDTIELGAYRPKLDPVAEGSRGSWHWGEPAGIGGGQQHRHHAYSHRPTPLLRRWIDSFRRDPNSRITPETFIHSPEDQSRVVLNGVEAGDGRSSGDGDESSEEQGVHYYDLHAANLGTANTLLARELKGRHLQMIAIGGSVGTGLFIASGKSLHIGGPASLLIAYGFIGVMMYCTCQALGELAVTFPVAGSFSAYSTRFLDPAWGFAMGWNYALQWLVVLPLEIIAASITVGYWNAGIHRAIFVTIFLALIVTINLFGVKGYGEAEYMFSIIKITAVVGFILLGIVINIGGFPNDGYIGGRYWTSPGAFNNGFKGTCSVLVTAAFAFTGTELVGLAAAEAVNPRKTVPTAIKQVFWRITLFYIAALTLIGLLVPHDHPELLDAESNVDATASPFVIAIDSAGIAVLPGIMNSVILVAVLSVGNSAVFGSSRTLAALADQRQAPKLLGYVDRRGRPLMAIIVAALFGLIGYLADLDHQSDVLNWLLAVSGLSSIFTWGSICLAHIRFRKAWRRRGRTLADLAFTSQAGVLGSWLGLALNVLVLVAQFWTAAWPVRPVTAESTMSSAYSGIPGGDDTSTASDEYLGKPGVGRFPYPAGARPPPIHDGSSYATTPGEIAEGFFLQYVCVPVVLVTFIGHKLWFRTRIVRIDEMDIDTGRRDVAGLPILMAQEREEEKAWPRWKRWYRFFC